MPTYRATVLLRFAAGGGAGTNTWHFRTDNPIGIENEPSTIMGWVRDFYTACAPFYPSSTVSSWDGSYTEVLTDAPAYSPPVTGWSVNGTNTDQGYAGAASMAVVTWRTELASRSGRGRTFVGPLAKSVIEGNGSLTTTALATLRAAGAALVGQSNTNDGVGALGVFSPTQNVFRDMVGATVTDQVAVLRSRRD